MKRDHEEETTESPTKKPKTTPPLETNPPLKTNPPLEPKPDFPSPPDGIHHGLTEYLTQGFTPLAGQFKSRVEDFIVTEVEEGGRECVLSSFSVPERPVVVPTGPQVELVELPEGEQEELNKVVSKEKESHDMVAPTDKAERTALHKSIARFNSCLSSETVKVEDGSIIRVKRKNRSGFQNRDRHIHKSGMFLHFTLLKWNISTADAIFKLSKLLNNKPKSFSYAGLKDKRGITSQRVCCRLMEPKRLLGLNKPFFGANKVESESVVYMNSFLMGDFKFSDSDLKLGQLQGNKFSIVLRDCLPTTAENLTKIRDQVLENGFINYFGLQRFGNNGDTNDVGKLILKKEYKSVIETILTPNSHNKPNVRDALLHFKETGNARASLEKLKFQFSLEGAVLGALAKDPTNYKGALTTLQRQQQTLYTHAYQSYLWNRTVSRRVQEFGTKVLPGDLVWAGSREGEEGARGVDEGARGGEVPEVRRVKEGEEGDLTLADVLLPLPGYCIEMPDNQCKDYLLEAIAEDGLSLDNFGGPLGEQFNLKGAYRPIIYKPSYFSASAMQYTEEHEKLVKTNLDTLLGREMSEGDGGDRSAIRLEFTLPKSCYATMLLREITRNNRVG